MSASRQDALRLAAEACCDWRTAQRALDEGLEGFRDAPLRARLRRAMAALALVPPSVPDHEPEK